MIFLRFALGVFFNARRAQMFPGLRSLKDAEVSSKITTWCRKAADYEHRRFRPQLLHQNGRSTTSIVSFPVVLVWLASDTATYVLMFLIVFVIQNTENRVGAAIQSYSGEVR